MRIPDFRYPDKPFETSPAVVGSLDTDQWITQKKYDGWRLQVYYDGPNQVRCLTRVGNPMDQTRSGFQAEVRHQLEKIQVPAGTVLDCEFIGPRGNLPFAVYIFDMLAWDGEWLVNEPYEKRWQRCLDLDIPPGIIHTAETVESEFVEFFNRLKADWDGKSITLCEGIVIKARNGKMKLNRNSCKKSDVMMKLKFREIRETRW